MTKFAKVPIEAFMDARLSKTHLRVLTAILSFCEDGDRCVVNRQQISDRCGLVLTKISTATTQLEKLGWIKKSGKGGAGLACEYVVTVPRL